MLKLVKIFVSSLGFLHIILGSTITGAIIGFGIYKAKTDAIGIFIAIVVAALGLAGGVVWAIRVSKKQDPADYVSQVRASPDLDGENPGFFQP